MKVSERPKTRAYAKPDQADFARALPVDYDAEVAVIGAMLLSKRAVTIARNYLEANDFYREAHQRIFAAICNLEEAGTDIDVVTLSAELKAQDWLDQAGGVTGLTSLAEKTPTAANIENYAGIVKNHSLSRKAISKLTQETDKLYGGEDPNEVLNDLFNFSTTDFGKSGKDFECNFETLVLDTLEEIARTHAGKRHAHIPSHFRNFDKQFTGWECGCLTVLLAPPKEGKSQLMIVSADRIASSGVPVGYAMLDMQTKKIPYRFLSRRLKKSVKQIEYGWDVTFEQIKAEAERFAGLPLRVAGVKEIGVDHKTCIRWMRYAKKNFGTKIFFVDSFQKFNVEPSKGQTDESYIAGMINDFQKTAQDLDVAIVGTVDLGYSGNAKGSSRWSYGSDGVFKLVLNREDNTLKIESVYLRNGEMGTVFLTADYKHSSLYDYEPRTEHAEEEKPDKQKQREWA